MARLGRQEPTTSRILPYTDTYGAEAIALYNKTGRTAQQWQEALIYDLLAVDNEGLFVHTKYGYAVPRRNGKNEVVAIREMYGLMNGEHILHTAHRTTTSHAAWERICDLLAKTGLVEGEDYHTTKQFGLETVRLDISGGKLNFRTRSSKGGLGEGYDLLVIDEAQEYTDDQESALKYVVSDSPNPQTLFCGTPPTPISSGTVFTKFRKKTLSGEAKNSGWAEWSVESETDPHDVEAWYETNPSLGTILTERKIEDEIGNDVVDFNVQRLGLWISYNQKSEISKVEWENLAIKELPQFTSALFVGVKFDKATSGVSVSLAIECADGRIFVETYANKSVREGTLWIVDFCRRARIEKIVIDGNGGSELEKEFRNARIKNYVFPKVNDFKLATFKFEQNLFAKRLCHMNQPGLTYAVSNCEKRAIGNDGFGYKSIKFGGDISIMESMILAQWAVDEFKRKQNKQRVSY